MKHLKEKEKNKVLLQSFYKQVKLLIILYMVHTKSSLFETHSLQVHCVNEKQYIELNIFLNHIATVTKPHIFSMLVSQ